jgi:predicted nucleotidyltransferase
MHPDPPIIDERVRRIVEAVHPQRIILFGSAARGEMGPNSDLDVLVIMLDGTHRRRPHRKSIVTCGASALQKTLSW